MRRIYLDNSATTPVDAAVLEAMMPYLTEHFGNASSIHFFGQQARASVDKARHQVAELINARPNEIVFTSGGTEANNLAIRGLIENNRSVSERPHIITSAIEHPAVRNVCERLEKNGCDVTYLPVYEEGVARVEDLRKAIRPATLLISMMTANNEIGTLQPVSEIGRHVRQIRAAGQKIWFHTDAVQAVGKVPVDVEEIGCDLLSISAHKIYAPKGIGALYVRRGTRLAPQNVGGMQQRGVRGGTESVAHIAAFGKAAELSAELLASEADRIRSLRDRFESKVLEDISGSFVNGSPAYRVPSISNISFSGIEGEGLLINLDMKGIAVATGSACSSGSLEPSPVIKALGVPDPQARGAVRFSFGRFNSDSDVDESLLALPAAISALRSLNPVS